MSEFTLRPRIREHVPAKPEMVLARLQEALAQPGGLATGEVVTHHVMIRVPMNQRHYWSPQLDLEIDADEQGGSLIRGLVGPTAGVWTKYIFLYAAAGFATLIGLVIASSQWTLHKSPSGLWIAGIGAAGLLATYLLGQVGKRIAHQQTWQLCHFLDDTLQQSIAIKFS